MKGKFDIYPLLTIEMIAKTSQEKGKHWSEDDCVRYLFAAVPQMRQSLNYSVISEEYYWRGHSQVVLFPEDTQVIERLLKAKLDIKMSSGIRMPHESFILAFPRDYKINGQPAQSCLITQLSRKRRFTHMHEPFTQKYFGTSNTIDETSEGNGIHICYRDPLNRAMTVRSCIPETSMTAALHAKTPEQWHDVLGSYDPERDSTIVELSTQDILYQMALIQIIMRVAVYASACDSALREGYPTIRPKHLEPKGISYTDKTLQLARTGKGDTKEVYRSWFFRQLVHERYYRGEHAGEPIGSRIVFVTDTVVNQKIEAETLK